MSQLRTAEDEMRVCSQCHEYIRRGEKYEETWYLGKRPTDYRHHPNCPPKVGEVCGEPAGQGAASADGQVPAAPAAVPNNGIRQIDVAYLRQAIANLPPDLPVFFRRVAPVAGNIEAAGAVSLDEYATFGQLLPCLIIEPMRDEEDPPYSRTPQ